MRFPRASSLLPVLLFAAMAVLLAGCGEDGGDKDAYLKGLEKMQGQLEDANAASKRSGETVDVEQRRAALGEAGYSVDDA